MKQYIPHHDELGNLINRTCNELHAKILKLDLDAIEIEPFFKSYFIKCHIDRVVFSLKTSAVLLYDGIVYSGKKYSDVVVMDYGAGIGTLYTLAKMIGVKKAVFNDLMPELENPARAIDKALGVRMDEYIIGDILTTCETLSQKNIQCDLIFSRNVLEHIYDLEDYFATIYKFQPQAISYNSTTANWNNPAAHLQHLLIHRKARKTFKIDKAAYIKSKIPNLNQQEVESLSNILLQYGGKELENAVENYQLKKEMPKPKNDYTNICDMNGMWAEHLLPFSAYKKFATNYDVKIKPGFWDVDSDKIYMRWIGRILNPITLVLGDAGVISSSFIYIIGKPKVSHQ